MEKSLGLKIQQARKEAGYTQQQLCQNSGLSYSTLAKIERGAIKAPSIFTIQQIAQSLGISMDVLIGVPSGATAKRPARKRSKGGIEFVYFDINGCLVHFYHRAFSALADSTGTSVDIIETTFWKYNDLVCRGDMSVAEFNNILGEKLNSKNLDWTEYYMKAVEPIEETVQLVNWVSEHYQIGLLSNIMPGFIDEMLKRGLLPNVNYDAVIDSSKTGYIKPEEEIYKKAQEASGANSEEILFIDDSRANIMAAGQMGWHVLWFDDSHPAESVKRIRQTLEF
jgi:FMN phosphatase YigB (HAD superfamily)/DNA-binding XRE family transcriptional regulator